MSLCDENNVHKLPIAVYWNKLAEQIKLKTYSYF